MSASPDAVRAAFDAVQTAVASDDVLAKAVRVCNEFGLDADALASHWESFALNHAAHDGDRLTGKALDALRSHVKRSEAARLKKEARSTTFRRDGGARSAAKAGLNKNSIKGMYSTPSPPKRSLPSTSQTQKASKVAKTGMASESSRMKSFVKMASTYKERPVKSRGTHAAKPFNEAALRRSRTVQGGAAPQQRCKITLLSEELSTNTKTGAMHMYTPPARKAQVLDRELHIMAERLIREHKLGGAPGGSTADNDGLEAGVSPSAAESPTTTAMADALLEPVGMPSQTSVLVCGRVCCHIESRDGVGTLNSESLLLEGSRSRSNGVRVRLDVSHVPNLDLFPGQVSIAWMFVCLGCLFASFPPPPQPPPAFSSFA